eukprot:6468251-Amphidinium_carterae.1
MEYVLQLMDTEVNFKSEVKLHYIGNHFYLKATVFDGLHNKVDYTKDFESWHYDWHDDFKQENMVYGLRRHTTSSDLRRLHNWRSVTTRSKHTTYTPNTNCSYTRKNRRTQPHSFAILPLVQTLCTSKEMLNRQQYHQKGGLRKQSITQIDYNHKHFFAVLIMCEFAAGLGHATMVQYKRTSE